MERTVNKLVILGSTGSVGRQTLDIVRAFPGRFEIVGLCNGFNTELLKIQIDEFSPRYVGTLGDIEPGYGGAVFAPAAEIAALPEVDFVMASTVGCAGMSSTLAALSAGKTVGLANKEVVIMAGQLHQMKWT